MAVLGTVYKLIEFVVVPNRVATNSFGHTQLKIIRTPLSFAGGGRALIQKPDRLASTIGQVGLPCMGAGGTACSLQRNRGWVNDPENVGES